ncbi:hypothetical protein BJ138DRAFT_1117424 [Hygrophoropsis aurantiaca]|uniref:Uncharacterized protein n=1 Tax=Hygrophoropsis aurantiaca TaxID=72124 RepID=A0ACB8A1N1_9AGAM|nr:hypothetical protein BJ138DRAFT_1117424 [Hygrophoropsis aurantiaca]
MRFSSGFSFIVSLSILLVTTHALPVQDIDHHHTIASTPTRVETTLNGSSNIEKREPFVVLLYPLAKEDESPVDDAALAESPGIATESAVADNLEKRVIIN